MLMLLINTTPNVQLLKCTLVEITCVHKENNRPIDVKRLLHFLCYKREFL